MNRCLECSLQTAPGDVIHPRCHEMQTLRAQLATTREQLREARAAMGELTPTKAVLHEVLEERRRQDAKWGVERNLTLPLGADSSLVVVAESARASCDRRIESGRVTLLDIAEEEFWEAFSETDPVKMRKELVQLAACAVLGIECIDARTGGES